MIAYLKRVYRALKPQKEPNPFVKFTPDQLFSRKSFEYYKSKGVEVAPQAQTKKTYLLTDSEIGNEDMRRYCQRITSIDEVPEDQIAKSVFYVYFRCDSDAIPQVKKIIEKGGTFYPPIYFDKTSYRFVDRAALETLRKTWAKADRLSHLSIGVHENICEAMHLTRHLEGDFVEIGVYLGGSAFTALTYLTTIGLRRRAWLFDTFDGFNYEQAKSSADAIWIGTHKLYGAEATKRAITEVLSDTGQPFQLIEKNICQGPLPEEITKIAVANIDVDIYEATLAAMNKVAPRIVPGGIMICEDVASTPGLYGAAVAMHNFLATGIGQRFIPIFKTGQYFLVRKEN